MTVASPFPSGLVRRSLFVILAITVPSAAMASTAGLSAAGAVHVASGHADHLVVSEVVTGGASASDELIELHNPTDAALPLEGLEVIYVTATGATISRRATWAIGAPDVPPGGHVLIANVAGIFASIADATYASGMAATGGSVAIRILGASTAIDAAGWGTATSAWLEGTPASAPAGGSSIERLPGGSLGSGQDTDENGADFVERLVPDPQNLGSLPTPDPGASTLPPSPMASPQPSATPDPSPDPPTPLPTTEPTPLPTTGPTPTPAPTPTPPSPMITSIADARAAPDGTEVTIEGVTLTSSDFHDGGGFLADATGGIAVLVASPGFTSGERLRLSGEIDDRFSQRTLRVAAGSLLSLGPATAPPPVASGTGSLGESLEGRLARITASILGSPTVLTAGLAFDVDDGTGASRVVVGSVTGIDTAGWVSGARIDLVGVVGQRDSSGSGTDGYRLLPRGPADVLAVALPTPTPGPSGSSPSPSPHAEGITSIADARGAPSETQVRVRGVVTLPSGLVDEDSAVIQDSTGAILLRLGEDAGQLRLGARVEVEGRRSTFGGMESLRVTQPAAALGTASEPAARTVRTGDVSEADEALLVLARGAIVASARRSSKGTVSFEIDDGSGPLRVSLAGRLQADPAPLSSGTWVEVRGVLGQETSLSRPDEGYRVWPRTADELRVTAPASDGEGSGGPDGSGTGGSGGSAGGPAGSLDDLDDVDLAQLRIAATLVSGRWRELGVGGLLWDGEHLVAIHAESGDLVGRLTRQRRPPIALDLGGLRAAGTARGSGLPIVRLGTATGQTVVIDAPPAPPRAALAGNLPAWVSVVGRLSGSGSRRTMLVDGQRIAIQQRCDEDDDDDDDGDGREPRSGTVIVTGVALGEPVRLLVPCHGIRAAPSIAGGALAAIDHGRPVSRAPTLAPVAFEVPPDPRRPMVAALLLVAAFALVGGAFVARRRASSHEEPAAAPGADDLGEAGARLTLVRAPHEAGP